MQQRPELSAWDSRFGEPEPVPPLWLTGPLRRSSDAKGFTNRCDTVWQRFTGRAFDASLPGAWLQDVHPEDRSRCESIHREMLASHASYNLDFRLRHAELGYRWVVETAIPVSADDGRFGGFEHHAVDIHDRTALSERLADRLARKRSLLQSHAAFAAALANEVEQLPKVQMKSTLDAFAAVTRDPMLRRSTSKPVDVWLGEVVDAACAAMPLGKTLPMLLMPAEPLEINLDCRALSAAMTNALVCTAVLGKEPLSPEQAAVRAVRVDSALFVDLPALPGSSAFVLLDIALRACGLPAGQVSHATDGERRWRVALPLAEPRRGQLR